MKKNEYLSIGAFLMISLLVVGCVTFAKKDSVEESKTVKFNTSIVEDATPAVLASMIEEGKEKVSKITFERGTYHFYPDKGKDFFCHISNHDDVIIKTAFPIIGKKNITIDGQGSTFIFHGRMIPFLIEGCENIKIKNVEIDWAETFHSEAKVVGRDLKKGTFDLEISDRYPYEIRNGELVFIKEYYEHTIGQSIFYDPSRNAIAFCTEYYSPITTHSRNAVKTNLDKISYKYKADPNAPPLLHQGFQCLTRVEQLKPGLVRVHNHKKRIPELGWILVGKGEKSFNRIAPAVRIKETSNFEANNVTVHHAGGMGLIAESSSDLLLDSFNVTPSNGRMVSTTADATHFVGCRGQIEIKNCTFNNQLDDAVNVHGTYLEVQDILGSNKLGVRIGHFQQQGFKFALQGDTIGLVRLEDSFYPYNQLTIDDVVEINGRYLIITFNEDIPTDLKEGDLLENLTSYPKLLVENCDISRNRARGILISTPREVKIINNYFNTEMEALLIPVESSFWYESGSVRNLQVINNVFQDCTHSGQNRGVIRFVTDEDNENIAFKNVLIKDNTFNHFDNLILEVNCVSGFVFEGNTITNSGTFPGLFPENPVVLVNSSEDIKFEKNEYKGTADSMFEPGVPFDEL